MDFFNRGVDGSRDDFFWLRNGLVSIHIALNRIV